MKQADLQDLSEDVRALIAAAQNETIMITSCAKPVAIVYGFEDKDEEDMYYENSREFWKMIEASRRSPIISCEEAKKRLFPEEGLRE